MKLFTRTEIKFLLIIFSILSILTTYNINISIRRGRDNQRKNDLSTLQKALDIYQTKHQKFPKSIDGKIAACQGPVFKACNWSLDSFEDISILPRDPKANEGREYLYLSNIKGYAVYIALEGTDEAEYSESILKMGLKCGSVICNYGREYNFE